MPFTPGEVAPTIEAFLDGSWVDISEDVQEPLAITRGASAEGQVADPSRCALLLADSDSNMNQIAGTYDEYNPLSPYYGLWGQSTPLRVYLGTPHLGEGGGSSTASTSHVAPSVTATEAGLLACMWLSEGPADYTLPGGMTGLTERDGTSSTSRAAYESVAAGATGTRTATVAVGQEYAAASVVLHGTSLAVENAQSSARASLGNVTLTTPTDTEAGWWLIALQGWEGDTVSAMPDAPYGDAGGWIALADSDVIEASGTNLRVRAWVCRVNRAGAQDVIFAGVDETAVADNHAALIVVSGGVADWDIRFHGEVSSVVHDWEIEEDVVANVTAQGILRRLQQGSTPLRSAPYRYITAAGPLIFWPFDEGRDTTTPRPAVGTSSGLTTTYEEIAGSIQFGSGELTSWLPPALLIRNTFVLELGFGTAPTPTASLAIDVVRRAQGADDASAFASTQFLRVSNDGSGTEASYYFLSVWNSGAPTLELFYLQHGAGGGSLDTGTSAQANAMWDLQPHQWRIEAVQDGTDVDVTVYLDGEAIMSGTHAGYTLQGPRSMAVDGSFVRETHLGYFTLWMDDIPDAAETYAAITGHRGETAGRRFERLCHEEGVAVRIVGDPDDTEPMGPQATEALVSLLRTCEATDMGILYEPRETLALAYRTRESLQNQAATASVDYCDLVSPLTPANDDRSTRNDITVTRRGGASARAVRQDGPKGIDRVGRYDTEIIVDPENDYRLADLANWQLHLGLSPADRGQLAVHEAGHVVLAALHGLAIHHSTLTHTETQGATYTKPSADPWVNALVCAGGMAADSAGMPVFMHLAGSTHDEQAIAELVGAHRIGKAVRAARAMLAEHADALTAIAKALYDRGSLTGAEITEIMHEHAV